MAADARQLDRLFEVIAARKGADAASSYTAKLFAKGVPACVSASRRTSAARSSGLPDRNEITVIATVCSVSTH